MFYESLPSSSQRRVQNAHAIRSAFTTALLLLFLGLSAESVTISVEPDGETIQSVLDRVEPGDVIEMESGIYFQDFKTRVDGRKDARITLKGVGGRESVVIRGSGEQSRVVQLQNDYYTLQDFTIDGQGWDNVDDVDKDNAKQAFRDILIYVAVDRHATERDGGYMSALDGLVIKDMLIQHALSECIRLRHFVTYAVIEDNIIRDCGLLDFEYDDGQNGEGVYVGTALSQWDEVKNFSGGEDVCLGNIVRNNEIETNGNEGVDVKEGCQHTLIENNDISMQRDENAGGISSHADNTVITGNTITNAAGAGVRVGTTVPDETGHFHGIDNTSMDDLTGARYESAGYRKGNPYAIAVWAASVTGNTLIDCVAYGLKIMSSPQGEICGNEVAVLPAGQTEETYKYSGGTYGDEYEPFEACDSPPAPSPTPSTPPPTLTSGAVYLGCFKDVSGERTMDFAYKAKNKLTNEACIERCKDDDKRFAGTTNARQCRCTDSESDVDRHGESTRCTKDCPRDSVLPCGGRWAVTSWEVI